MSDPFPVVLPRLGRMTAVADLDACESSCDPDEPTIVSIQFTARSGDMFVPGRLGGRRQPRQPLRHRCLERADNRTVRADGSLREDRRFGNLVGNGDRGRATGRADRRPAGRRLDSEPCADGEPHAQEVIRLCGCGDPRTDHLDPVRKCGGRRHETTELDCVGSTRPRRPSARLAARRSSRGRCRGSRRLCSYSVRCMKRLTIRRNLRETENRMVSERG
jgi:hypothetical protein